MQNRPKILVTGAKGQLGMSLRDIAPGFPGYDFIFFSREELPVDDRDKLRQVLNAHQPQWLVNCAAYTAVDKAEQDKETAMRINAGAVGNMAELTREHHCGFIHISTDYVFDGLSDMPYPVDHPCAPQNEYGRSKMEGEQRALLHNPASIIIRSSWIYSEHGHNFVKTMKRLMKERDILKVVSDQKGSPTYARDLAQCIMTIIGSSHRPQPPAVYHFSNKGIISWYEFALAIKELLGSPCQVIPVPATEYPTPARRPYYSALDNSRIEKEYGVELKDWKLSLKNCFSHLK